MDEKLNFILNVVENDKKMSHASEKNPDLTNFETDFPIKSFDELDDVENKISTNTTYRLLLVGIHSKGFKIHQFFINMYYFLGSIYFLCGRTHCENNGQTYNGFIIHSRIAYKIFIQWSR